MLQESTSSSSSFWPLLSPLPSSLWRLSSSGSGGCFLHGSCLCRPHCCGICHSGRHLCCLFKFAVVTAVTPILPFCPSFCHCIDKDEKLKLNLNPHYLACQYLRATQICQHSPSGPKNHPECVQTSNQIPPSKVIAVLGMDGKIVPDRRLT